MPPFRFREDRVTQAASLLLQMHGGRMEYMKLIKLLYYVDRLALFELGRPVSWDAYYSLKHGPILSQTLNLINDGPDPLLGAGSWHRHISAPERYHVALIQDSGTDMLSDAEVGIVRRVFLRLGSMDVWDIVRLTHEELPEYKDPGNSSIPIQIRDILRAQGMAEGEVNQVIDELSADAWLESLA